jgi:glycine/D-amino acid oxidase-like deaminating enzyme
MEIAMEQTPLIIGAGPTGLSAAMFLAEAGVPGRIIDNRIRPASIHGRRSPTRAVWSCFSTPGSPTRYCAKRIQSIASSSIRKTGGIWASSSSATFIRISRCLLPQARTKALLSDALAAFGVAPERGTALGSFRVGFRPPRKMLRKTSPTLI